MEKESILIALRRRWWLVVLFMVLGALVAALPNPSSTADSASANTRYQAAHTLLVANATGTDSFQNQTTFNQLELFATVGEVPARAAKKLGFKGNPAELAAEIKVDLSPDTGAMRISTTQDSAKEAVGIADAFAEELTSYLAERQDALQAQRVAAVQARLDQLQQQIEPLQAKLVANPDDPVIKAQVDALSRQYSAAYEQQSQLNQDKGQLTLTTLESAQAVPVKSSATRGLSAPRGRGARGVLGGIVGLVLGIAVAVVLARVDRRIRTRAQAEAIFGMHASVTVPMAAPDSSQGIVVSPERHDALSDSYRTLRSVAGFVEGGRAKAEGRAPIILVVSASPGDGKTSVSANLAAAFVETGSRTVAINTDFRRPALSVRILGSKPKPLSFHLSELHTLPPRFLLHRTPINGLALVDLAGTPGGSHGALVRATAQFLPQLAQIADAIVIDTSPVGATAEVLELVPQVDLIVVVSRLNNTSIATATRTMEILRSLTHAEMLLTVVGDASDKSDYYYYYEYSGTAEEPGRKPKRGRNSKAKRPRVGGSPADRPSTFIADDPELTDEWTVHDGMLFDSPADQGLEHHAD